jgi:16S rRNA (cytidine1402-2'-O)-methyltransferase
LGFPPAKGSGRRALFERVVAAPEPSVLFEAPHRIQRTLEELAELAPARPAVLCRELTKLHEELRRGTLAELASNTQAWRGEITLVVDRAPEKLAPTPEDSLALEASIVERLGAGESPRTVVEALLEGSGLARRDLYRQVMALSQRSSEAPTE